MSRQPLAQPAGRRQHGFTLLELIIALTLAGLATVIGAAALSSSTTWNARARERVADHEQWRALQRVLRIEWAARQPQGFVGLPAQLEYTAQRLAFDEPLPGGHSVRLHCESLAPRHWVLWHELLAPASGPVRGSQASGAKVLVREALAEQLTACDFAYLERLPANTSNTPGPSSRWVSRWPEGRQAPQVLRLSLADRQGPLPPLIFVATTP